MIVRVAEISFNFIPEKFFVRRIPGVHVAVETGQCQRAGDLPHPLGAAGDALRYRSRPTKRVDEVIPRQYIASIELHIERGIPHAQPAVHFDSRARRSN